MGTLIRRRGPDPSLGYERLSEAMRGFILISPDRLLLEHDKFVGVFGICRFFFFAEVLRSWLGTLACILHVLASCLGLVAWHLGLVAW